MTFGTGPYGFDFSGFATVDPPVIPQGQIPSSRKIDINGRFVQVDDDSGAFAAMTDTMQRVTLRIASNVQAPSTIDDSFQSTMDTEVRQALEILTGGDSPVAELLGVFTFDNGKAETLTHVKVRDLTDGQEHTIPARTR